MRLRLPIKFFLAFSAMALLIIGLMIVIMQYFAYRHFTEYVNKVEKEILSRHMSRLRAEYQAYQGWDHLKNNSEQWQEILMSESRLYRPPRPALGNQNIHRPRPRPPKHPDTNLRLHPPPPRRPDDDVDTRQNHRKPRARGKSKPDTNRGPGGRPPFDPNEIIPRLTLFDKNRQAIAGSADSDKNHLLVEITLNNETIGWLGLKKKDRLSHPLNIGFLKRQSHVLYTVGVFTLILAGFFALLISRHLLAPIKQLTNGARALGLRNFNTRITVHSTDELGKLAADFNMMAQTLEKYEQMRQHWISDISHELRTPLSILRGEIEAIQDGIRKATPESMESIHEEILHLIKLVNDLHELTLVESGILHLKNEPVNPLQILNQAIRLFENRFAQQQIAIFDEIDNQRAISIIGDKDRLTQLYSNILENTLKYTESPGTLTITHQLSKNRLYLFFDDTKPGVSDSSLHRLFDRLYRVDISRNRKKGGSGLGLAICKNIIEMHGGSIRALHSPTGGVRIHIELPMAETRK